MAPVRLSGHLFLLHHAVCADPDPSDYCDMLGQDDIQGKKMGFLAGNKVYYSGGNGFENETIGLTHPFHHDLRSRGSGIAFYEGVGMGNDFWGWEFHRETKVAYGTIVTEEMRWENPTPTRMFWCPDKIIVEYKLMNPYLQGVFKGWCSQWEQGSDFGDSFWINLSEDECWDHCKNDSSCFQAVFEGWMELNVELE